MQVVSLDKREAEDRGQLPADRGLAAAAGAGDDYAKRPSRVEEPRAATYEEPDGLAVVAAAPLAARGHWVLPAIAKRALGDAQEGPEGRGPSIGLVDGDEGDGPVAHRVGHRAHEGRRQRLVVDAVRREDDIISAKFCPRPVERRHGRLDAVARARSPAGPGAGAADP